MTIDPELLRLMSRSQLFETLLSDAENAREEYAQNIGNYCDLCGNTGKYQNRLCGCPESLKLSLIPKKNSRITSWILFTKNLLINIWKRSKS